MITEDYVSFETAKLLKDKGFNYPCRVVYSPKGIVKHYLKEEVYAHYLKGHKKLCPTLQMAMKWLREVHKLSIEPYYDIVLSWVVDIKYIDKYTNYKEFEEVRSQTYNSYEEAVESAIKYCLENLI